MPRIICMTGKLAFCPEFINSLPKCKILDQSKLKAFTDDNSKVIHMAKFVLDKMENIVGKEKNAGYQHFLLFPTMLSKGFFFRVVKNRDFVVKS